MTLAFQVEPLLLRVTNKPIIKKESIVFFAVEVEERTWANKDARSHYIVEVEDNDVNAYVNELALGVVCKITPNTLLEKDIDYNGITFNRKTITTKHFSLVRSEGALITKLLSSSKFKCIGELKAKRLWDKFGNDLYEILDNGRIELLTSDFDGKLTKKTAESLISSWKSYLNSNAIKFCSKLKLSISQTTRVIEIYRELTKKKIIEDPYRLLAFNVPFKIVDKLAIERFDINSNDPKRVSAAMEEILYQLLDKGSVVADKAELCARLEQLLLDRDLAQLPFENGFNCGNAYMKLEGDTFQSNGSYIMESFIAKRLCELVKARPELKLPDSFVAELINQYQEEKCMLLTELQKSAVFKSMESNVLLINGGAGVGKTTVLDAIYHAFDQCGIVPIQVALAGKAAKRMKDATQRKASTIAKLVWRNEIPKVSAKKLALIIDESSMVDLFSMYQLLKVLPEGARIIMLGDSVQLHPVGYGLIFQELLKVNEISKVTLTEIKRQKANSSIPFISHSIAQGKVPEFNTEDVIFENAVGRKKVISGVLSEFNKDQINTQIICATNSLAKEINSSLSSRNKAKKLSTYNHFFESFESTGFKLDDRIICTKNLYDIDVMNGTLGKVVECYNSIEPKEVTLAGFHGKKIRSVGRIQWEDGSTTELSEELLSNMSLAYAITIHKSQGSQYRKVIIPAFQAPNMDRSMLYTAITRAEKSVFIIGSEKVLYQSIDLVQSEQRKADLANKITTLLH